MDFASHGSRDKIKSLVIEVESLVGHHLMAHEVSVNRFEILRPIGGFCQLTTQLLTFFPNEVKLGDPMAFCAV